jgi:hypothetical protein
MKRSILEYSFCLEAVFKNKKNTLVVFAKNTQNFFVVIAIKQIIVQKNANIKIGKILNLNAFLVKSVKL